MSNEAVLQPEATVTCRAVDIEHVSIRTTKPYARVKEALEAAVHRLDDSARALLERGEIAALRTRLEQIAGDAGLAIHYVGPHGDWLALQGERRACCTYFIGNVLYAVQMTSHELAAGLYAPLRVVIYEPEEGGGCIAEYDRPSTQFGQFSSPAIDAIAAELDARLHRLLLKVCNS
jgi:uncharacterized protein (DUF302 family)